MLALSTCTLWAQAVETLGLDLQGRPILQLASHGEHLVVLLFAASDCPISNRYVPEIARLNREFATKGVRFWWVFPNGDDTAARVRKHVEEFSIHEDVVLDTRQALVGKAHATVTPEAAVFEAEAGGLREVYHGRIDDRYIAFGQERPRAKHHELEMAIAAALEGKPVPQAAGPPVGCSVEFLRP
jgi:AhpC/TSA family